ncbi:unnamed protein product, partial [Urochloa humidicola]
ALLLHSLRRPAASNSSRAPAPPRPAAPLPPNDPTQPPPPLPAMPGAVPWRPGRREVRPPRAQIRRNEWTARELDAAVMEHGDYGCSGVRAGPRPEGLAAQVAAACGGGRRARPSAWISRQPAGPAAAAGGRGPPHGSRRPAASGKSRKPYSAALLLFTSLRPAASSKGRPARPLSLKESVNIMLTDVTRSPNSA